MPASKLSEQKQISFRLTLAGLAGVAFLCWASVLSFFPVPWPDDSAFFLPGIDWIHWPSHYRMHAQAPFVPSYDTANFNTMPGMPLMLGLGNLIGFNTSHEIRFFGVFAWAAWAILLAIWMKRRGFSPSWIAVLSFAALLAPTIRWGSMVVRPEVWQGLFWLLMLMELDGFFKKPNAWRLPALLAAAAYYHFEAILWVLPVSIGLYPFASPKRVRLKLWFQRLLSVGFRTAALLSPWLIYVLVRWNEFWDQMRTQFGRLEAYHPYIQSLHSTFHSLFLELGNPAGYPKYLNLGKGIFWIALVLVTVYGLTRWARKDEKASLYGAAVAAIFTTFYLWFTKPETWFTAMIHMAFWPLLILAFNGFLKTISKSLRPVILAPFALLLVIESAVAVNQWNQIRPHYSWDRYRSWVDCVESQIGNRKVVWQPHWPDVLVEMAGRNRDRDYYRAVDFQNIEPLIQNLVASTDVIIHSLYLPLTEKEKFTDYLGGAREMDLYYLKDYPWLPFQKQSAPFLGEGWNLVVCQKGPFWAALSLREARR